jgi:hypothetical protein
MFIILLSFLVVATALAVYFALQFLPLMERSTIALESMAESLAKIAASKPDPNVPTGMVVKPKP